MIAKGWTLGMAEGIIDDTYVLLFSFSHGGFRNGAKILSLCLKLTSYINDSQLNLFRCIFFQIATWTMYFWSQWIYYFDNFYKETHM